MPEKEKKQKKDKPVSKEEIYQNAIHTGINNLASQPGLRNYNVLIRNTIDDNKVYNFIQEAEKKFGGRGLSEEQQFKEIYKDLANYVASGEALKDTTKQTILEEGLERGVLDKVKDFFIPNRIGGAKYFEKARNAYADMYDILSQDKGAQESMPELVKAAQSMRMYGFLDAALRNFKAHGIMDDKTYKVLSRANFDTTSSRAQKGAKGLESFILTQAEKEKEKETAQKVAASIIGFIGVFLLLFNLRITGAVIGGNTPITVGIVGVFMIFFALLLFFRPLKRSFKK